MTFDISLEAIEADLALADRDPGGRLSNLAVAKAQIRATLLAAGILGPNIDQQWTLTSSGGAEIPVPSPVYPSTEDRADTAADVAGIIIDGPTDPDDEAEDDFFAEARRERD